MAESIYTQLENQTAITPVNGIDYTPELPEGLFPTAKQFEDPDQLVEWTKESNYTAMLIQKGLQKGIIEVRACFKSCPKDKDWSQEMGDANLAKMAWKSVDRPNQGNSKVALAAKLEAGLEMAQMLKNNKQATEFILTILTPTYGEQGAQDIINALT